VRVVSLVPSVTETLLAWGVVPVACTRFCEQPDLPHVGGTKDPDVAAIVSVAPVLLVVDREENHREYADALAAAGCRLHVTHVTAVADVEPTLCALSDAVGVPSPRPLLAPPARPARRRAFVPIWRRPWMTLNGQTYGSSVLAAVGIGNVYADAPERYPTVTLHDVTTRHPDLVLAPTEPYPFSQRHLAELQAVADDARVVDGKDLFWWGVRTPGALQRLAAQIAS